MAKLQGTARRPSLPRQAASQAACRGLGVASNAPEMLPSGPRAAARPAPQCGAGVLARQIAENGLEIVENSSPSPQG